MNLNGKDEAELYEVFPGSYNEQMPKLLAKGLVPISVAKVFSRRMHAPKDVIDDWKSSYFHTGDGSVAGRNGDALISLDDPYLLDLNPKKELYENALVLSDEQWEYLKSQEDKVLHLTIEDVKNASGGYALKNGIWTANKTIRRIYEGQGNFPGLLRGEVNVREYAELVAEKSRGDWVMGFYSNRTTKDGKPTLRSLVLNSIVNYSYVDGNYSLSLNHGRFVGVAEIANPGVKVSAYRGHIPTLEKKLEEVTEEPDHVLAKQGKEQLLDYLKKPWYKKIFSRR